MTGSVHRTLIDWLRHIRDHGAQKAMQVLGRSKVDAKTGNDIDERVIVGVNDSRSERNVDDAVVRSHFRNEVNVTRRQACIMQFPKLSPYGNLASGLYDDLVIAQNHPLLFEINARSAGLSKESSVVSE